MSKTMNLLQVPEALTLRRALLAGRTMSGLVVIALLADGIIQLFVPTQIASLLQETGFAMDLTRVVGPIILACAVLYAIPATAVLGAILVTGFLGGAISAHLRLGELGSPPEIKSGRRDGRISVGARPESTRAKSRRESLCSPARRVGESVRTIRHPEGPHRTCRRNV